MTKKIILWVVLLTFFSSSLFSPIITNAASKGLDWSKPSKKIDLNLNMLMNTNNLMAVIGCTGIVDSAASAALKLASKITETIFKKKLKLDAPVSTSDEKLLEQKKKDAKREACFNGLAYSLAKQQLLTMTKSTMEWVNSGFNGDPLYVRDVRALTSQLEDEVLKKEIDLFKRAPSGTGDYPYGRSFALSQINFTRSGKNPTDSLKQNLSLYLDTSNNNYMYDYARDFSIGGWDGWLAFTQTPQNNPLGFSIEATNKIAKEKSAVVDNTKTEIQRNGGMLDQKKCVQKAVSTNSANNKIDAKKTAANNNYKKTYDKYIEAKNNYDNYINSLGGDVNNIKDPEAIKELNALKEIMYAADLAVEDDSYITAINSDGSVETCTEWEVVTPGSLINEKVSKYLNSPETQLELADSLNEVLYSIFDNLISSMQMSGLSSLSPSASSGNGIGSNRISDTNGKNISNSDGGGSFIAGSDFDITNGLGQILTDQYIYIDKVNKLLQVINNVVSKIGELDYCIPGPNPNWQSNSTNVKDAYINWLNNMTSVGEGRNYILGIPQKGSAAYDEYLNQINDSTTNFWAQLTNSQYFQFPDISSYKANDNMLNAISSAIETRSSSIEKIEKEYAKTITSYYGITSPMQTEYLNNGTDTMTENPSFLPMAQAGLNITKDIVSYVESVNEMTSDYQNNIIETKSNIYKLKKLKEKIDIIVNRAQKLRAETRAKNGLPIIVKECLLNEQTVITQ